MVCQKACVRWHCPASPLKGQRTVGVLAGRWGVHIGKKGRWTVGVLAGRWGVHIGKKGQRTEGVLAGRWGVHIGKKGSGQWVCSQAAGECT